MEGVLKSYKALGEKLGGENAKIVAEATESLMERELSRIIDARF